MRQTEKHSDHSYERQESQVVPPLQILKLCSCDAIIRSTSHTILSRYFRLDLAADVIPRSLPDLSEGDGSS
jgi:hypothetical protein